MPSIQALTVNGLRQIGPGELDRLGLSVSASNIETSVAPAAAFCLAQLTRRVGQNAWQRVSAAARTQLTRQISSRVAALVGPALTRLDRMLGEEESPGETISGQQTFLHAMSEFPAFAETVHLVINDWVHASAELLLRFDQDAAELIRNAGNAQRTGTIRSIVPALSDPHNGCRTVTQLQLDGGGDIIYKPRSCTGEVLWNSALCWINHEGFHPAFRCAEVASKRGYGWVEFIGAKPCDSMDAVHRAFHRWGALTAVAEALRCVDLHHENWIHAGEHPILVDVEAYGEDAWKLRRRDGRRYTLPAYLRTGLFPMESDANRPGYRGTAPFDTVEAFAVAPRAWPVLAGTACIPSDHADKIAAGYATMFSFLRSRRSRIRRITQIATRAAQRPGNRLFVRSTAEYHRILQESLSDLELFGADTRYATLLQRCAASAPSRALAAAEANALLRCSVPRFTTTNFRRKIARRPIPSRSAQRAIRRQLLAFV